METRPPTRKGYATTKQVAEFTGFAEGTLRNWRSRRQGPPFTGSGPTVRYRWADVERWMQQRT